MAQRVNHDPAHPEHEYLVNQLNRVIADLEQRITEAQTTATQAQTTAEKASAKSV